MALPLIISSERQIVFQPFSAPFLISASSKITSLVTNQYFVCICFTRYALKKHYFYCSLKTGKFEQKMITLRGNNTVYCRHCDISIIIILSYDSYKNQQLGFRITPPPQEFMCSRTFTFYKS